MGSKLLETKVVEAAGENTVDLHNVIGGEARLLGAVIKHAIYDWLAYRNSRESRRRRIAEVARRWIFSTGEDHGTFDLYCNLIGADPTNLRNLITKKLSSSIQLTPQNVLEITSSISS